MNEDHMSEISAPRGRRWILRAMTPYGCLSVERKLREIESRGNNEVGLAYDLQKQFNKEGLQFQKYN